MIISMLIFVFMDNTPEAITPEATPQAEEIILRRPRGNYDITIRILHQYQVNWLRNLRGLSKLNYQEFPPDNFGHLDVNRQVRLVGMLESHPLTATRYRYGSSLGNMYVPRTYRFPPIDDYMLIAVFQIENSSP